MHRIQRNISLSCLLLAFLFLVPVPAEAARSFGNAMPFFEQAAAPTGVPQDDVQGFTGRIINRALTIVGLAFFALLFYGGFLWLTARGAEEQITKARNIIIAAVIGIAIIVAAYAITTFVTQSAIEAGTADAS